MSEYQGCENFSPLMRSYKREWFNEKLFVDLYGRESNLSDVPMTYMTRSKVFSKRGYNRSHIDQLWKSHTSTL